MDFALNTRLEGVFRPHHRVPRYLRRRQFNPFGSQDRRIKTARPFKHARCGIVQDNIFNVHSLMEELPGNRVLQIQWLREHSENKGNRVLVAEVHDGTAMAEIRLPCNVNPGEVQLDLNEQSRMLTLRVRNWEQKLMLDRSFDLRLLKASFDETKNELCLKAPAAHDFVSESKQRIEVAAPDVGYNSEEEQPPIAERKDPIPNSSSISNCSDSEDHSSDTSSNAVLIEDVGPEEEIDRISVSSSETM